MATGLVVLVFLIAGYLLVKKFIFPSIIRWRALLFLENILFPHGEVQKDKVVTIFDVITGNRFSREQAINYFIKSKGRQLLTSGNEEFPFWAKSYLKTRPAIDLTYFEKVKFHETFINYPKSFEVSESNLTNNSELEKPVVHPKPTLVYSKERASLAVS